MEHQADTTSEAVLQTENQTIPQDLSVSDSKKPSKMQPSCFLVTLFFAVVVLCVLVFVMVRTIPEFEKIFIDFDAELPVMTIAVIMASIFFASYWWCLLLLVPLVVWLFVKRHTIPVVVLNLLSLLFGLFAIVGILIGVVIFIACFRPLLTLITDLSS